MCPLRFILVFFSAILAGYCAWRTVRSSPGTDINSQDSTDENIPTKKEEFNLRLMTQNVFWVLVDMASGRYLWRKMKQEQVKTC